MWYSIAEHLASDELEELRRLKEELAKTMTPDQITKAQRMASEWLAQSRSRSTSVRHSVEPGATDTRVCDMAIRRSDGDWEKHPSFDNWIDEARNRGLELNDCVKLVKANEVIRDRAFGKAPDKHVCSMAIENGSWQQKVSLQKWVDEARDRGLTLEDCEKVLKANEVSRGSSTPSRQTVDLRESDGRVCIMARAVWQGKRGDEFDHWVKEAQKRNLTPEDCEKLLKAN